MQFTTVVATLMAAVAVSAQGSYGNTTTPTTTPYPATNGTSTNGTASPSGTVNGTSPAAYQSANAGNKLGNSAAMGLAIVGSIALVSQAQRCDDQDIDSNIPSQAL